jgi:hypothetical protein
VKLICKTTCKKPGFRHVEVLDYVRAWLFVFTLSRNNEWSDIKKWADKKSTVCADKVEVRKKNFCHRQWLHRKMPEQNSAEGIKNNFLPVALPFGLRYKYKFRS